MDIFEQMALSRAVREVEEAVHRDDLQPLVLIHLNKSFKGKPLLSVQLREPRAERVELIGAAVPDPVAQLGIIMVCENLPLRLVPRRHAELVQRVE